MTKNQYLLGRKYRYVGDNDKGTLKLFIWTACFDDGGDIPGFVNEYGHSAWIGIRDMEPVAPTLDDPRTLYQGLELVDAYDDVLTIQGVIGEVVFLIIKGRYVRTYDIHYLASNGYTIKDQPQQLTMTIQEAETKLGVRIVEGE